MFEGVPARALPGVEDTRGRCGSCEDSAITSARFDRSVPDEALAMLTHIAHMIDRTRNRFSESHFDEEADVACRFRSRSRKFRNTSSFALHEKSDRPGSR